jgi:hypothetical protein
MRYSDFSFFAMWVTLSTAIAEERQGNAENFSVEDPMGAAVAALSYDNFGKGLRLSQPWCFICDRE